MKKTVYKYGSFCYETQKKAEVVQSFMEDMRMCPSVNVKINKSSIAVYVPGGKYSCVYNVPKPYLSCIPAEVERFTQLYNDGAITSDKYIKIVTALTAKNE